MTGEFASTIELTHDYVTYKKAVENAKTGKTLKVKNTDKTQGKVIGKSYDGTLTLPEAKYGQSWICLMTLVSDDGCTMSIDDRVGVSLPEVEPWLKKYGIGNDISKGANPWPGVFVSGKTYKIKIHYSQVWYKPNIGDLDGISVILCLTPVEVDQPTISVHESTVIVDVTVDVKPPAPVDSVRMCRWASPRDASGRVDNGNRADFPNNDPDRIIIHLPLGQSGSTAPVTVHVSTTGSNAAYTDTGADVLFTADPDKLGYIVSPALVLVADSDDNALPVGPSNAKGGQPGAVTFLAAPGGKLRLTSAVLSKPVDIPIQGYQKQITVKNIFVGAKAKPNNVWVTECLRRMKEIYAQNHIKVNILPDAPANHMSDATFQSNIISNIKADHEDPAIYISLPHAFYKLYIKNIYSYVGKAAAPTADTKVIKLIWISPEYDNYNDYFGLNLNLGDDKDPNSRPDICLMFMGNAQHQSLPVITLQQLGEVAAHEIGHGLGLATGLGDHLDRNLHAYKPWYLMCKGADSNDLKFKPDAISPDSDAKHWELIDVPKILLSPFCKPATNP